jgi:hypothetical protein
MGAYFSFERMITTTFVKVLYFLGFLALTAAGVALAIWAGMQLNDATISRSLGWRYVAFGVGLVVLGNIIWRVFCELWVVLFGIHSELVSVRYALNLNGLRTPAEPIDREVIAERDEIVRPREVIVPDRDRTVPHHTGGVLGLS